MCDCAAMHRALVMLCVVCAVTTTSAIICYNDDLEEIDCSKQSSDVTESGDVSVSDPDVSVSVTESGDVSVSVSDPDVSVSESGLMSVSGDGNKSDVHGNKSHVELETCFIETTKGDLKQYAHYRTLLLSHMQISPMISSG